MKRLLVCAQILAVASCAPTYVWGGPARIRQQLLEMVPPGSSRGMLNAMAARRGWRFGPGIVRIWPAGTKLYFEKRNGPKCRSFGGPAVSLIVAHYSAPLQTYVETLWLFDADGRLADVCVRKDVDAP